MNAKAARKAIDPNDDGFSVSPILGQIHLQLPSENSRILLLHTPCHFKLMLRAASDYLRRSPRLTEGGETWSRHLRPSSRWRLASTRRLAERSPFSYASKVRLRWPESDYGVTTSTNESIWTGPIIFRNIRSSGHIPQCFSFAGSNPSAWPHFRRRRCRLDSKASPIRPQPGPATRL
jgi:hypothetical protein